MKYGWISWSDWHGCPIVEKPRKKRGKSYRDFESARAFVQALDLGGSLNWPRYVRGEFTDKPPKPADIPASPRNVYKTEWQGWGDWHGTGNIAPVSRQFRPFAEARAFARTLDLNGSDAYRQWWQSTRPADLPSNPAATYAKDGFTTWPDFLQAAPHLIVPSQPSPASSPIGRETAAGSSSHDPRSPRANPTSPPSPTN